MKVAFHDARFHHCNVSNREKLTSGVPCCWSSQTEIDLFSSPVACYSRDKRRGGCLADTSKNCVGEAGPELGLKAVNLHKRSSCHESKLGDNITFFFPTGDW